MYFINEGEASSKESELIFCIDKKQSTFQGSLLPKFEECKGSLSNLPPEDSGYDTTPKTL